MSFSTWGQKNAFFNAVLAVHPGSMPYNGRENAIRVSGKIRFAPRPYSLSSASPRVGKCGLDREIELSCPLEPKTAIVCVIFCAEIGIWNIRISTQALQSVPLMYGHHTIHGTPAARKTYPCDPPPSSGIHAHTCEVGVGVRWGELGVRWGGTIRLSDIVPACGCVMQMS